MNARTRSALLARVAILESGGKDDSELALPLRN